MAERLTPAQSARLIDAYRATFTADNHGDALKAMYSKFELVFDVPHRVLRDELRADRNANLKLYQRLWNEQTRRASRRESTDGHRSPSRAAQVTAGQKPTGEAQTSKLSGSQPVRCPECDRRLAHASVQHYGKKPGRLCGGSAARKPTPMAVTLAKWNIELARIFREMSCETECG